MGNPGLGKTYFCAAYMNKLDKNPHPKIRTKRYWNEKDLLARIRSEMEITGSDYSMNLKFLIDDDLVILDDLGASGINEWRRELFFDFLDYRYMQNKPTIITTNLTKQYIYEKFDERFYSRFFAAENDICEIFQRDRRLQV
jgi:DNA replication protein DnaC